MDWTLITAAFGDRKYHQGQVFLSRHADRCKIGHRSFSWDTIVDIPMVKENIEWFSKENNYGYFAWKPAILLDAMSNLPNGQMIFTCDSLDLFHPHLFSYVEEIIGEDHLLLAASNSINGQYTKRDCFVGMDCDDEDYWESPQLEAGFSFWKVCDESREILKEWFKWCIDPQVNGDFTDVSGEPQIDGFKETRHDQSILTNLAIRDGLPSYWSRD